MVISASFRDLSFILVTSATEENVARDNCTNDNLSEI